MHQAWDGKYLVKEVAVEQSKNLYCRNYRATNKELTKEFAFIVNAYENCFVE